MVVADSLFHACPGKMSLSARQISVDEFPILHKNSVDVSLNLHIFKVSLQ